MVETKMNPSLDEVQERLEELFSRKNLNGDAFLQQHMNAQLYIPVTFILQHARMKSFDTDSSVIIAAAKQSINLGVDDDEEMVRPVLKQQRNTLILRDLPADVTEDELRQLFASSPENEAVSSVKPDVNQTAFVAFGSDEAAQKAALWLRSQKLRGAEIKCAMKSEHFVRSFFPASTSGAPMSPYVMPGQPAMGWPPMYGQWSQGAPYEGSSEYEGAFDAASYEGAYEGDGWMTGGWGPDGMDGAMAGRKGKGKGKGRRGKGGPPMDDMMSQFEHDSMFDDDGSMGGIPAGYQHEYRKFSRQHIVEVCNSMAEITKPDAYKQLETDEDAMSLFREEPCKEWAPLPSLEPLFPPDERRSSEDQSGDFSGRGSERKERTASWSRTASGRRQPRSQSQDLETYHEEADWAEDPSWGQASSSGWRQKGWSSARSGGDWSREKDHSPDRRWATGPQWVEKGKSHEGEEGGDGKGAGKGEDAGGVSRQLTWAEKVRGSEGTAQKWVEKKKAEPDEGEEKARSGEKQKAGVVHSAEGGKAAGARPDEKPEVGEKKQEGGAMSWADKVRRSAS